MAPEPLVVAQVGHRSGTSVRSWHVLQLLAPVQLVCSLQVISQLQDMR